MSKFVMGMVPNEHQSTLNPPLLLCPTLTTKFLNPIKYLGASNIILKPLHMKNSFLNLHHDYIR
jgi:hypothetical protein